MSAVPTPSPIRPPLPQAEEPAPLLENGDRLTRGEFERRYRASPAMNKAQLIEGKVYMPSPVRVKRHGKPHLILASVLGYYIARTPGLETFGDNVTVRLDEDNVPQPDLFMALPPAAGGKSKESEDDYLEGPPELVCEIASSSVNIDLHDKLNAYRRNGVLEYLVWRVNDSGVDWYRLHEGDYRPLSIEDGVVKSVAFPGLWLNVAALLRQDLPALFATIDQGVATPAHAEFLKRLSRPA